MNRVAAVLFVIASGCAGGAEQEPPIGTSRQAIVNGTEDDSSHDSVVRITSDGGACTGTLIAPNLVATARHCVSVVGDDNQVCNADGTGTGGTGADITSDRDPATLDIFSGVDANTETTLLTAGNALVVQPSTTTCHQDIAFIVLAEKTTLPYAPIRRGTGAIAGELLTLVGYGLIGVPPVNTELPEQAPAKRRIRKGVAVRAVGPGGSLGLDTLGAAEFSTGEGACSGDSGGPAFGADGALVGAVSRGGGGVDCIGADAVVVFTDVAKYGDLIDRAFTAAGYPGGPPPYIAPPMPPMPKSDKSDGCRMTPGESSGSSTALALIAGVIAGRRQRRNQSVRR